ncbi:hypothetical protein MAR_035803 [Mya arenaria]|uniref:Uncharacterized protein n=1 Tax=Mya arenaria TaxID=6604 RepID=A0ABY7ENW2_MYAAR|nr:hypothetical protein MAR_035803 [Mya arenaria]
MSPLRPSENAKITEFWMYTRFTFHERYTYTTSTESKILKSKEAFPCRMLFYAGRHSKATWLDCLYEQTTHTQFLILRSPEAFHGRMLFQNVRHSTDMQIDDRLEEYKQTSQTKSLMWRSHGALPGRI